MLNTSYRWKSLPKQLKDRKIGIRWTAQPGGGGGVWGGFGGGGWGVMVL